jgi:hypothetical protein
MNSLLKQCRGRDLKKAATFQIRPGFLRRGPLLSNISERPVAKAT